MTIESRLGASFLIIYTICALILILVFGIGEELGKQNEQLKAIELKLDMIEKHLDMVHPDE